MSCPRGGVRLGYECGVWTVLLVVVGAWVVVAIGAALLLGRTVRVADRRRPRPRRAPGRAVAALGRAVSVATGSIPVLGPRIVSAVTSSIPVIRPRID